MSKAVILLCLLLPLLARTQVNFSKRSLQEAMERSRTENKLIFLQFESASCQQCNETADKGLSDKEIGEKINGSFVCLKIDREHSDRAKVAALYNLNPEHGFGTLFIDANGTVVHKYLKSTTFSKQYATQADLALSKLNDPSQNISNLEKEYNNGNRNLQFMASLLQKRSELNMPTDALLEEYVAALPQDSLESIHTLVLIAKMAPAINSPAYKVLYKDHALFNKAWYSMDLSTRIVINNMMITKSREKAVREKDEKYAIQIASYASNTNTDRVAAAKAYDLNMLRFYEAINDSSNYFKKALAYYDRYYYSVPLDSVKMQDSVSLQRIVAASPKETVVENGEVKKVSRVVYAPAAQRFGGDLNNGAYAIFKKTNDPHLLSIATKWAEKAIQFYKSPAALDTYAKLLYKQNQVDGAVSVMNDAIQLQKERGFPTNEYEADLDKMKKRLPITQ